MEPLDREEQVLLKQLLTARYGRPGHHYPAGGYVSLKSRKHARGDAPHTNPKMDPDMRAQQYLLRRKLGGFSALKKFRRALRLANSPAVA